MIIKYFVSNESKLILDLLEYQLCSKGISYVKIDNEIHFNDKIIRILDLNNDKNQIFELSINKVDMLLLSNNYDKTNLLDDINRIAGPKDLKSEPNQTNLTIRNKAKIKRRNPRK